MAISRLPHSFNLSVRISCFNSVTSRASSLVTPPRATMATLAHFKLPAVTNEPNKHYAKDSTDRLELSAAIAALKAKSPLQVPAVVAGKQIKDTSVLSQPNPAAHKEIVAQYTNVAAADVNTAIEAALAAKPAWENLPFADRAAIFLKAADLISTTYRYELMAATIVGQGKNAWQAEIDAAAELIDFLRFNVKYAEELYSQQPAHHSPGIWNRVEYRALDGFVYAITPFNFTAIAGNLPCAPALMGNVVVWKPSPSAIASNWILYNILIEAGLPPNVIQFVPGDAETVTAAVLDHRAFASLHFTGSTSVFRKLYGAIAQGTAEGKYASYPRVIGETGGKNFHLIHRSAAVPNAVINTVRGAFEFQGQKCSACSRLYVPTSLWESEFKPSLVAETKALTVGNPQDFSHFIGPVIHAASFAKLRKVIDAAAADPELELLVGGAYDDTTGYFIHPTIYQTTNPNHPLLSQELFGPILVVYAYDDTSDAAFAETCALIERTTSYALTGAVFARNRDALRFAEDALRSAAGNFYVNCKCTGAVVGQQPFGGGKASGTNDKAGSAWNLLRFVNMRAIKEQLFEDRAVAYPSNEV